MFLKFIVAACVNLFLILMILVVNNFVGEPIPLSALLSSAFALVAMCALEVRGLMFWRGSWRSRLIIVVTIFSSIVVGAIFAELLGVR